MNNIVILIGRICRNIELKETNEGKKTCNVTLAISRNYKSKSGEYLTDFISCKAFGSTAELIDKYCKKGDTIGIKGNILTGNYEKDGKKVYTQDIVIQEISFLKQAKEKEEQKEEAKTEAKVDPFKEFGNEADLSDIGIADDELPF